jgi:hypothetical protein
MHLLRGVALGTLSLGASLIIAIFVNQFVGFEAFSERSPLVHIVLGHPLGPSVARVDQATCVANFSRVP